MSLFLLNISKFCTYLFWFMNPTQVERRHFRRAEKWFSVGGMGWGGDIRQMCRKRKKIPPVNQTCACASRERRVAASRWPRRLRDGVIWEPFVSGAAGTEGTSWILIICQRGFSIALTIYPANMAERSLRYWHDSIMTPSPTGTFFIWAGQILRRLPKRKKNKKGVGADIVGEFVLLIRFLAKT